MKKSILLKREWTQKLKTEKTQNQPNFKRKRVQIPENKLRIVLLEFDRKIVIESLWKLKPSSDLTGKCSLESEFIEILEYFNLTVRPIFQNLIRV